MCPVILEKGYSSTDLSRIIRRLILEKYLSEELKVSPTGVVFSYVKPGPKAPNIKNDNIQVHGKDWPTQKIDIINEEHLQCKFAIYLPELN